MIQVELNANLRQNALAKYLKAREDDPENNIEIIKKRFKANILQIIGSMKLDSLDLDKQLVMHSLGVVQNELPADIDRAVRLVSFEKASTKRALFHDIMQNCIEQHQY